MNRLYTKYGDSKIRGQYIYLSYRFF